MMKSCFLACLLAVFCVADGRSSCKLAFVTSLPLSLSYNQLRVPVTINGKDADLTLDTGASANVLSAPTATRLRLHVLDSSRSSILDDPSEGVGGGRTTLTEEAQQVAIGDLRGSRLQFDVFTGTNAAGSDADLLGMNFLSQYDIDLDLLGGKVTFFQGEQGCGKPAVLLTRSVYVVPQVDTPGDTRVFVSVTIDGQSLKALIDTGATRTTLFGSGARRLGLTRDMLARDPQARVTGIGRRSPMAARHLSAPLQIGGLTVSNMRLLALDQDIANADMLLGMDFLSKVHLWISNSSRTVVLQAPPEPSPTIAVAH